MEEWKSYKLGDIATIQTGPFGSQLHQSDYVDEGIPCIMPTNIGQMLDFHKENLAHITKEDSERLSRHLVHEGEIIYSRRGDIEKCAYVSKEQDGWFCGTGCLKISITSPLAVPKFVAYQLSTSEIRSWIVGNAVGTTMLNLNTSVLSDVPLRLPELSSQMRIVEMLDSLSDKIALNNRINHNLEEQAQALYKSWFIDFEPFNDGKFVDSELGMIPEGWRVGNIYDICDVYYGAPFNSTLFNTERKGLPLIRIRDLAKQEAGVFTEERHPKGQLTCKGDILVGMDGEFSIYIWGGEDSWINQRITRFSPKPGISHYFLTETLRPQLKAVEASEVATTVIHIGKNDYDKFLAVIPSQNVLDSFYHVTEPLYLQYVENLSGNHDLSESRDILLPRLMSGQVTC